ncbi:MAG: amidohydrolase family protein [Rhodothermales bacterium]
MTRRLIILSLFLLLPTLTAPAQDGTERGDVLVRNATVLTITNGTLENTDILIRNGKIEAVGQALSAPSGVETIDASGMYVMPGIIDAHSHIALSNVNESSAPVTAQVSVGDVLNPYHIGLYRALAGGVTTSHLMHGSANVIGGQNETIKHRWGVINPDGLRMEGAPRTIKFALGENPTRVHGRGSNIRPASRMGVEFVARKAFSEAQRYREAWDRYEAERRGNPRAIPPAYNGQLEVITDILDGDIIINCHSYRADEILMLMQVLEDFGIDRITFQHVNEGFKIAPELAAFGTNGAGASIFADWWAYKFEVYYSTAYNAAILIRNGVVASINSDSGELNRHLYHEAAKSQKYGDLTDDEALSLITINPALQLGIEDRVGSIEVGKDGDLAIFNAHPLSIYAVPQKTIVDGIVYFDIENDPDDMRLTVDPEAVIETATLWEKHDYDQCMQDTGVDLYDFFNTGR